MKKFKRKVLAMLMTNNFGSSLRQQLFDGAPFRSSLLYTAVPQRAATGTTATFTRATAKRWKNNDGYLVTGLSGEIGFPGARRIRNYISASSEDFSNASWTKLSTTVVVNQAAAPNGTLTADLVHPASSGADRVVYQNGLVSTVVGDKMILEIYAKYAGIQWLWFGTLGGGTTTAQLPFFDLQNGVVGQAGTYFNSTSIEDEGDGWYRCIAIKNAITAAPLYPIYGFGDADGSTTVTANGADGLYLWGAQLEDVTAQTTQTAGEYVSVGALIHDSQDPNYLSLPGTAGHYASTPDSVAASIVGDIAVVSKAALTDWTPTGNQVFISKDDNVAASSYLLYIDNAGKLNFRWSPTGGAPILRTSSVAVGATDATVKYIAAALDVDNGTGYEVRFYTSSDGSTWTQLGTTQATVAAVTRIFDSATPLYFGGWAVSALGLVGNLYSAQIYNGIPPMLGGSGSATPVVDFNVNRDATTPTGTITSSTTGEVWTINGASSVVRNAAYHGSMVDGVKCFATDINGNPLTTMERYKPELAATNTCLQSNAFTTAPWAALATPGASQNATGPNGQANYAWTLTDNDAANYEGYQQNNVAWAAGASGCYSILVGKKASSPSYPLLLMYYNRASNLYHYIIVNEVAGTVAIGGSTNPPAYGCVSYNDDFWLVWVSGTQAGATVLASLDLYPAASVDGTTLSTTKQGSTVFCDAQFESGATYPSSRIATTTVAVTRNADNLTYSGGDIPNLKTLCATFRRESGVSGVGVIAALSNGTLNEYSAHTMQSATNMRFEGVDGGVLQWATSASNAYSAGATSKVVQSTAANDIKMAKDGIGQTADTTATLPTTDRLEVGHLTGSYQLSGNVGGIYGWTRNLSQSKLNAITA